MNTSQKIWIIGASSGIGAALAKELAKRGHKIALSARRDEPLSDLKEIMPNRDDHLVMPVDASHAKKIQKCYSEIKDEWGEIDRVIYMAGLYTPNAIADMELDTAEKIIQVNLMGALYTVDTVLKSFLEKKSGQIALCASVAGYRGLPNSQPYGASKAGLINYAESLRAEYGKIIDIKMINPGFVETRLTDKNDFKMPMKITSEKAAIYIADGLETKSFDIHFPKRFTFFVKLLSLLPNWLYFPIIQSRTFK